MKEIRSQFPTLKRQINNNPLIYFDSGATALKPQSVMDSLNHYYTQQSSNVHRSAHILAEEATIDYEATRDITQKFINATHREEVIFTSGTTEAINMVARILGDKGLPKSAEILLTEMEHHSNIVPWQLLAQRTGISIKVAPVTDKGEIDLEAFEKLINENTYLVAFNAISNTLGTINPVKKMVELAHKFGALTLIDAAQATPHGGIDVQDWDCDFLALSAHKAFGPTAAGALYGKKELLESLPPFLGGGDMIDQVDFDGTSFNDLPYKFEAGTPKIASIIAMKEGLKFINEIGEQNIREYELKLRRYFETKASEIPSMKIIGNADNKIPTFSFLIDGVHANDYTSYLSQKGIAIRVGHHCTQPLMKKYGVPALSRASLSVYNTEGEIDSFFEQLQKALEFFA